MYKAVQQFQLRANLQTEVKALETLKRIKEAGYEAIELNGFMIRKMSTKIRLITKIAGMPVGKSGHLDWEKLISKSGLSVISLHEHLGTILNNSEETIRDAKRFNTKYVVITGMQFFDYSNKEDVKKLCEDLNKAGEILKKEGLNLLYHNHNVELRKINDTQSAYDYIIENTNPDFVNFEFDSYWMAEAGIDCISMMKKLSTRLKLYHINDRGFRAKGRTGSIMKSDSMELGYGNMNLVEMVSIAKQNGCEAVVLETHKNWINNSGLESAELSAHFMCKYVN